MTPGVDMSPWDMYRQILRHLDGGRLTMELDGGDIRFEWWPLPTRMVAYYVSLREFQAARWDIGHSIANALMLTWSTTT